VSDLLWLGVNLLFTLTLTTLKAKASVDVAFFVDASLSEGLTIFKLGSAKNEADFVVAGVFDFFSKDIWVRRYCI
jgi:hypothetical protein